MPNLTSFNVGRIAPMLSGMMLYGAGRAAAAVIGLGAALILPHFVAPNALGQFYVMISAATYLGVVMRFGGEYVLFRQSTLETNESKIRRWDSKAFGQATRYLSFNCLILFAVSQIALNGLDIIDRAGRNLQFIANDLWKIFLISFNASMLVYLYQISKSRALVIFSSLVKSSIINLIFVIAVILLHDPLGREDISRYVSMYLSASLFSVIVAIMLCRTISIRRWITGITTANPTYYRTESWYSFFYSILFVVFTEFEILLASIYLNPGDVAVYGTARRMTLACSIFVEFANVFLPRLISKNIDDRASLSRKLSNFSAKIALIALLVIVAVLLLGEWVLGIVLPASFAGVADVLPILLLVPFVAVLLGPSEILLLMHSKQQSKLILSAALIVAIGAQLAVAVTWLIPAYGIFGLAWSSVIAMATYRIILMLYTHKFLAVRVFPGAR